MGDLLRILGLQAPGTEIVLDGKIYTVLRTRDELGRVYLVGPDYGLACMEPALSITVGPGAGAASKRKYNGRERVQIFLKGEL